MSKKLGTLSIKNREFQVTDATLSGKIRRSGPVEWFLEVVTEKKEVGGEFWSPAAYIEQYPSEARSMEDFIASPIIIKSGAEFCGYTLSPGCRLCCLHVFEDTYLDRNHIQFERSRGNRLKMIWSAKCAVHRNKEYGSNLDLRIETLVNFLGFSLDAEVKEEASTLLANKFEPKGLSFHIEPGREGSYFLPVQGKW